MNMQCEGFEVIGRNDLWQFGIGKLGDRWVGVAGQSEIASAAKSAFASEGLAVEPEYLHILSEVSEESELGMRDKRAAILLIGALAQDPESGFGGIDKWFVPEELRGDPEKFRCERCATVGCSGKDCSDCDQLDDDFDEEGDFE